MKNKTVLTEANAAKMEMILQKLPEPMTAGQVVRYLEENSSLVPRLVEDEGVSRSTFISRIVNTAKFGKNNKIAILRKPNGSAKFHLGCGYLLYYDETKINYTKQDVEKMKHHAQGKIRPKARKRKAASMLAHVREQNSGFVNFMSDDVKRFESLMQASWPGDWTNLEPAEKKKIYLNFSANVEGGLKKLIFGDVNPNKGSFQVVDNLNNY